MSSWNENETMFAAGAVNEASKTPEVTTLDPFDPNRFKLPQNFTAAVAVKKLLTLVPVRKPAKEWFVRVRPGEAHRMQTYLLELKEDRESYLVDPSLWADLAAETTVKPVVVFTAISRHNVVFLWPVRLPGEDGKMDEWSRSSLEAAQAAEKEWIRVQSNMSLGAYEIVQALGNLGEPAWPDHSFKDLLRTAFRGKLIDTIDHPVLKKLRGEL